VYPLKVGALGESLALLTLNRKNALYVKCFAGWPERAELCEPRYSTEVYQMEGLEALFL